MKKSRWVSFDSFLELYGQNRKTIECSKSTRVLPQVMFSKTHPIMIDTNFVQRRIDFRMRMWNEAHEIYYKLHELFGSDIAIARMIAKLDGNSGDINVRNWNQWMSATMFQRIDHSFILRARDKDYLFTRFGRWLLSINKRKKIWQVTY